MQAGLRYRSVILLHSSLAKGSSQRRLIIKSSACKIHNWEKRPSILQKGSSVPQHPMQVYHSMQCNQFNSLLGKTHMIISLLQKMHWQNSMSIYDLLKFNFLNQIKSIYKKLKGITLNSKISIAPFLKLGM